MGRSRARFGAGVTPERADWGPSVENGLWAVVALLVLGSLAGEPAAGPANWGLGAFGWRMFRNTVPMGDAFRFWGGPVNDALRKSGGRTNTPRGPQWRSTPGGCVEAGLVDSKLVRDGDFELKGPPGGMFAKVWAVVKPLEGRWGGGCEIFGNTGRGEQERGGKNVR